MRRQEKDYFLRSLDCDTIYVLAKNEKKKEKKIEDIVDRQAVLGLLRNCS